MLMITFTK